MGFKRKNPGNQSIRRQLTFYMGFFVVLPLCLALMLLNFYLQKVTTENKINNETNLLSQIRDNADQMIEVTNYATSMLMTNKNTLKNLRTLEQDGDSYEIYQAKRELSNDISNVESSVLNAVNGKVAILTKTGYVIGSYALSRTETDYEKEQWYQEVLKNGRKTTYSTGNDLLLRNLFYRLLFSQLFQLFLIFLIISHQYIIVSVQNINGTAFLCHHACCHGKLS